MTFKLPRISGFWFAAVVALLLLWRVLALGLDQLTGKSEVVGADLGRAQIDSKSYWRERLARNPTDSRAIELLALQFERDGQREDADAAMRQALLLAPADRETLLRAADFFSQTGKSAQGLIVLRRVADLYPTDGEMVWPKLTAAIGTDAANEFFDNAARANPSWWQAFFRYACERAADQDGVQRMLMSRVAAGVATDDERRCIIARLQREGRWTTAYQSWLSSLPAAQQERVGPIFNGAFQFPLSNLGFDWILPAQEAATANTQPMEGAIGQRVLQVSFSGKRYEGSLVYQYLMLVPGGYRFEFRGRADGVDTARGLQWAIYCTSGSEPGPGREPQQLVRSDRLFGSLDWTDFQYDFKVPRDCPVQMLRLELANPRSGMDTSGKVMARMRGMLYFDNFKVAAH